MASKRFSGFTTTFVLSFLLRQRFAGNLTFIPLLRCLLAGLSDQTALRRSENNQLEVGSKATVARKVQLVGYIRAFRYIFDLKSHHFIIFDLDRFPAAQI